jgi:hypothetical protein
LVHGHACITNDTDNALATVCGAAIGATYRRAAGERQQHIDRHHLGSPAPARSSVARPRKPRAPESWPPRPIHGGGAGVRFARLALFVIGQGHRAQRQNLVDFRRVEQIALAFGCDLGVVVHNDGRWTA